MQLPPLLRQLLLPAIPAAGLVAGLSAYAMGDASLARIFFAAGTAVVLAALLVSIVRNLARREFGLDIIAALAMAAALLAGEELAGIVVALMYAGGQGLERFAQNRAGREMTALLARVPRTARRYRDGALEEIAIDDVRPGDRLLIASGEVVPVDGTIVSAMAVLDETALTGESLPVTRLWGSAVASGVTNAGKPFDLTAAKIAADSTFAGIVRLVDQARHSKAPMSRLADRYALGFLAVTLTLAGAAWAISGDPIRALAVLVIATPCPLILAVPVAIVAGMSRAARRGILVKSAGALETLARVKTLLLDKTGTLTHGHAEISAVEMLGADRENEVLAMAASVAQASRHVISRALVDAAKARGLALEPPSEVIETPGGGVEGRIAGHAVVIGQVEFVAARTGLTAPASPVIDGISTMAVSIDGAIRAIIELNDPIRAETPATLTDVRRFGIDRLVLVTGDHAAVAERVGRELGIDHIVAEVTPEGKVGIVEHETARAVTLMVGDGINDAAALARADVGLALGARGSAAASEAADVVVLVDRLDRVSEALDIARRTRAIALQSVWVGLGLSGLGMIAAALGYLSPLAGALSQEVIDVAVIANALRALTGPARPAPLAKSGLAR